MEKKKKGKEKRNSPKKKLGEYHPHPPPTMICGLLPSCALSVRLLIGMNIPMRRKQIHTLSSLQLNSNFGNTHNSIWNNPKMLMQALTSRSF